MKRLTRHAILDALGVTEDDMAVMDRIEELNGYTAAKREADAERAAFISMIYKYLGLIDPKTCEHLRAIYSDRYCQDCGARLDHA